MYGEQRARRGPPFEKGEKREGEREEEKEQEGFPPSANRPLSRPPSSEIRARKNTLSAFSLSHTRIPRSRIRAFLEKKHDAVMVKCAFLSFRISHSPEKEKSKEKERKEEKKTNYSPVGLASSVSTSMTCSFT